MGAREAVGIGAEPSYREGKRHRQGRNHCFKENKRKVVDPSITIVATKRPVRKAIKPP